jgi:hypothetical protein
VRLYVPATLELLRAWSASGTIAGHHEPYVAEDESEEAEHAALEAAADDSAELAPSDGRRVVLVVDVPAEVDELPMQRVVAVHADAVGARRGEELGWYATQEIDDLLDG